MSTITPKTPKIIMTKLYHTIKKIGIAVLGLAIGIFLGYTGVAFATSTFITQQGGTGTSSPSGILYGDNGATNHVNTVSIGTGLSFIGGVLTNTGASAFGYPFNYFNNTGTSSPLLLVASTTIGAGSQTTGLVVNGGATTTGNAYFAGTVGIGTQAPDAQLHVIRTSSGADANVLAVGNAATANSTGARINFNLSTAIATYGADIDAVRSNAGSVGATYLAFGTNYAALAERLRITEAGRVGIGTTSPGWMLDVATGTAPQLGLSDGTLTSNHYTFFSNAGNFYVATASPTTYATSSVPAIYINGADASTTLQRLTIAVGTTSASNGFNTTNGCYAINNVCVGTGTVTGVTGTYPILSSGGTAPVISTAFGTTTSWGMGNNGFVVTGATGIPFTAASSTLNLPNTALANSSITINGTSVSLGGSITVSSTTLLANNNTFSGANIFNGNVTIGTLTGPLQAIAGLVSASSSLSVGYGGTGSTTSLGGILAGNGFNGIKSVVIGTNLTFDGTTLNATGGSGSGTVGAGTTGQTPYYAANGTTLTATSSLFQASSGFVGVGSTSPTANLSIFAGSDFTAIHPKSTVFDIGSSTAGTATTSLFDVTSNGRVGIGSTSPTYTLSVGGNFWGSGTEAHFGDVACSNDLVFTGVKGLEVCGSDNTTNGVELGVGNNNAGTAAYSSIYLNNNSADNTVTHFAAISLNSSTYSDTTFGTGLAIPNQLSIQNTDGPITTIVSTTTGATRAYANWLIGGTGTLNEIMRIATSGVGIGTTSPFAKFSVFAGGDFLSHPLSTLFAIGSSTKGNATTTLFSVDSVGTTTLGNFGPCNTTSALTTNSGGSIVCGAISGSSLTGSTGQVAYFSGTNTAIGTSSILISTNGQVSNKNGDVLSQSAALYVSTTTANAQYTDVQSAINALPSTGGLIHVRCGVYTLPTGNVGIAPKVSGTVIEGEGKCTQFNFDKANTTNAVEPNTSGLENLIFRNFYIHQTNATFGGIGINASNTPLLTVDNVKIDGTATSTQIKDTKNLSFYQHWSNLDLRGNTSCVELNGNPVNDNVFTNIRCAEQSGNAGYGVYLDSSSANGAQDNTFINFDSEPTGAATGITAIYGNNAVDDVFINPYVEGNATAWNLTSNAQRVNFQGGEFLTNTTYTNGGSNNQWLGVDKEGVAYQLIQASSTIADVSGNDATSPSLSFIGNNNFAKTSNALKITFANSTDSGVPVLINNPGTGTSTQIVDTGTGKAFEVDDQANDSTAFVIEANGRVSIATDTPIGTNVLTANGGVYLHGLATGAGNGAICATTDGLLSFDAGANCITSTRLAKHDISTITDQQASEVLSLDPRQYTYNDGSGTRYGFIAEEVAKIDPKLVIYAATDTPVTGVDGNPVLIKKGQPLTVDYARYVGLLTAEVQLQERQIQSLGGGKPLRSVEENYQWGVMGLLGLYVLYNERDKRRKK